MEASSNKPRKTRNRKKNKRRSSTIDQEDTKNKEVAKDDLSEVEEVPQDDFEQEKPGDSKLSHDPKKQFDDQNSDIRKEVDKDYSRSQSIEDLKASVEWILSADSEDKIAKECIQAMEETAEVIRKFKKEHENLSEIKTENNNTITLSSDYVPSSQTLYKKCEIVNIESTQELVQSVLIKDLRNDVKADLKLEETVNSSSSPAKLIDEKNVRRDKQISVEKKKSWRLTWPASVLIKSEEENMEKRMTVSAQASKPPEKRKSGFLSRLTSSSSGSECQEMIEKQPDSKENSRKQNNSFAGLLKKRKHGIPESISEDLIIPGICIRDFSIEEDVAELKECPSQFDNAIRIHARKMALLAAKTDRRDENEVEDEDIETEIKKLEDEIMSIRTDRLDESSTMKLCNESALPEKEEFVANERESNFVQDLSETINEEEIIPILREMPTVYSIVAKTKNKSSKKSSKTSNKPIPKNKKEKTSKKKFNLNIKFSTIDEVKTDDIVKATVSSNSADNNKEMNKCKANVIDYSAKSDEKEDPRSDKSSEEKNPSKLPIFKLSRKSDDSSRKKTPKKIEDKKEKELKTTSEIPKLGWRKIDAKTTHSGILNEDENLALDANKRKKDAKTFSCFSKTRNSKISIGSKSKIYKKSNQSDIEKSAEAQKSSSKEEKERAEISAVSDINIREHEMQEACTKVFLDATSNKSPEKRPKISSKIKKPKAVKDENNVLKELVKEISSDSVNLENDLLDAERLKSKKTNFEVSLKLPKLSIGQKHSKVPKSEEENLKELGKECVEIQLPEHESERAEDSLDDKQEIANEVKTSLKGKKNKLSFKFPSLQLKEKNKAQNEMPEANLMEVQEHKTECTSVPEAPLYSSQKEISIRRQKFSFNLPKIQKKQSKTDKESISKSGVFRFKLKKPGKDTKTQVSGEDDSKVESEMKSSVMDKGEDNLLEKDVEMKNEDGKAAKNTGFFVKVPKLKISRQKDKEGSKSEVKSEATSSTSKTKENIPREKVGLSLKFPTIKVKKSDKKLIFVNESQKSEEEKIEKTKNTEKRNFSTKPPILKFKKTNKQKEKPMKENIEKSNKEIVELEEQENSQADKEKSGFKLMLPSWKMNKSKKDQMEIIHAEQKESNANKSPTKNGAKLSLKLPKLKLKTTQELDISNGKVEDENMRTNILESVIGDVNSEVKCPEKEEVNEIKLDLTLSSENKPKDSIVIEFEPQQKIEGKSLRKRSKNGGKLNKVEKFQDLDKVTDFVEISKVDENTANLDIEIEKSCFELKSDPEIKAVPPVTSFDAADITQVPKTKKKAKIFNYMSSSKNQPKDKNLDLDRKESNEISVMKPIREKKKLTSKLRKTNDQPFSKTSEELEMQLNEQDKNLKPKFKFNLPKLKPKKQKVKIETFPNENAENFSESKTNIEIAEVNPSDKDFSQIPNTIDTVNKKISEKKAKRSKFSISSQKLKIRSKNMKNMEEKAEIKKDLTQESLETSEKRDLSLNFKSPTSKSILTTNSDSSIEVISPEVVKAVEISEESIELKTPDLKLEENLKNVKNVKVIKKKEEDKATSSNPVRKSKRSIKFDNKFPRFARKTKSEDNKTEKNLSIKLEKPEVFAEKIEPTELSESNQNLEGSLKLGLEHPTIERKNKTISSGRPDKLERKTESQEKEADILKKKFAKRNSFKFGICLPKFRGKTKVEDQTGTQKMEPDEPKKCESMKNVENNSPSEVLEETNKSAINSDEIPVTTAGQEVVTKKQKMEKSKQKVPVENKNKEKEKMAAKSSKRKGFNLNINFPRLGKYSKTNKDNSNVETKIEEAKCPENIVRKEKEKDFKLPANSSSKKLKSKPLNLDVEGSENVKFEDHDINANLEVQNGMKKRSGFSMKFPSYRIKKPQVNKPKIEKMINDSTDEFIIEKMNERNSHDAAIEEKLDETKVKTIKKQKNKKDEKKSTSNSNETKETETKLESEKIIFEEIIKTTEADRPDDEAILQQIEKLPVVKTKKNKSKLTLKTPKLKKSEYSVDTKDSGSSSSKLVNDKDKSSKKGKFGISFKLPSLKFKSSEHKSKVSKEEKTSIDVESDNHKNATVENDEERIKSHDLIQGASQGIESPDDNKKNVSKTKKIIVKLPLDQLKASSTNARRSEVEKGIENDDKPNTETLVVDDKKLEEKPKKRNIQKRIKNPLVSAKENNDSESLHELAVDVSDGKINSRVSDKAKVSKFSLHLPQWKINNKPKRKGHKKDEVENIIKSTDATKIPHEEIEPSYDEDKLKASIYHSMKLNKSKHENIDERINQSKTVKVKSLKKKKESKNLDSDRENKSFKSIKEKESSIQLSSTKRSQSKEKIIKIQNKNDTKLEQKPLVKLKLPSLMTKKANKPIEIDLKNTKIEDSSAQMTVPPKESSKHNIEVILPTCKLPETTAEAKLEENPSEDAKTENDESLLNSLLRYPIRLFTKPITPRMKPDVGSDKRSQTPEISSLGSLEYALTDLESTEANSGIVVELKNSVPQEPNVNYTDLEFYDAHGSPEPTMTTSVLDIVKRRNRKSKKAEKVNTIDNRMSWSARPTRFHSSDAGSQDSFVTPPSPVSTWVLERVARSATLGGDRRRYYDLDRNYTSRPRPWSTLDFPPPECKYVMDDHLFPNSLTPNKIPSCKSLDEHTYNLPYMDDNAFPLYEPEWPLGDSRPTIFHLLNDPKYSQCKLFAKAERGSISSYKTAKEENTTGRFTNFFKNTFGKKNTKGLRIARINGISNGKRSPWD